MTKRHITVYILLALLCGAAYPFGRNILTAQMPSGFIDVGVFTLNYLLLFILAGAISPWISTKIPVLRRYKKQTASMVVMLTLVCTLLIILTLAGLPMRWTQ